MGRPPAALLVLALVLAALVLLSCNALLLIHILAAAFWRAVAAGGLAWLHGCSRFNLLPAAPVQTDQLFSSPYFLGLPYMCSYCGTGADYI